MRTEKLLIVSLTIMVTALGLMIVNSAVRSFPDWLVRVVGGIMLLDLVAITNLAVRWKRMGKKEG